MNNVRIFDMPDEFAGVKYVTSKKTIIVLNAKLLRKSGKQYDFVQKNLLNDISNIDMLDLKGFSIGILFSKGGDKKDVIN